MYPITVTLLGAPAVCRQGRAVSFPYRKAEGFFYYLCVKKIVTREEAVNIFWANMDEKSARKNLRDVIYKIRRLFGEESLIVTGNSTVQLNLSLAYEIDIDSLSDETIADSYTGPFLQHFYIKNCLEFEQWSEQMRAVYHDRYMNAVRKRLERMLREKNIAEIRRNAAVLIQHDLYNEENYCDIMRAYTESGHYNLAIKLYYELKEVLHEDLGEEPAEVTQRLFQSILDLKESRQEESAPMEDYFCGRYREVCRIVELINGFAAGTGKSVLISGEAGVGKTALLQRLRDFIDDRFVLLRHDSRYAESQFHLSIWYDITNQLDSIRIGEETLLDAGAVEAAYPPQGELAEINAHKSRFIIDTVIRIARKKKLIIMLDDIQWMDAASLQLIGNILFDPGPENVMMIAAYRDDYEKSVSHFTVPLSARAMLEQITLRRFTYEETSDMVGELSPDISQDAKQVDTIYRDTEGIPLFIVELLHVIRENGGRHLSAKATNIIRSRLLDLTGTQLDLLDAVSLFPSRVNMQDIKIFYPMVELEIFELLEQLMAKRLIREESAQGDIFYSFTHQKIREYVHEHQSVGKRRVLHTKIAEHYEKRQGDTGDMSLYSKLIYHYGETDNLYKTYRYRVQYAERLFYLYNEIFPDLSREAGWSNLANDVIPERQTLVDLAGEIDALDSTDSRATSLRMQIQFVLGRHYIHACEYADGLLCIDKSLNLARQFDDEAAMLNCHKQFVYYGIQIADLAIMRQHLDLCRGIVEKKDDDADAAWLLRLEGLYRIYMKDHTQARLLLETAIERIGRSKDAPGMNLAVCHNYLGNSYLRQGDVQAAHESFKEALKTCDKHFITNGLAIFYSDASRALYLLARYEEALYCNALALEAFDITRTTWGRVGAEINRALIEEKVGSRQKAGEYLAGAQRMGAKLNNPALMRELAEAVALLTK